jgi:hypothetical protein
VAVTEADSATALEQGIDRYNAAWNDHDVDAIVSMHAAYMVFANHRGARSRSCDRSGCSSGEHG